MTIGKYKGKDYLMGFRTGHFYLISISFNIENNLLWVKEWPHGRFCPYMTIEKLKENWDIRDKSSKRKEKQWVKTLLIANRGRLNRVGTGLM